MLLLDEADNAHPDVLQPFLNFFDEGWVTDHRGMKGYANKAIFILTSIVGQKMLADMVEHKKPIEEITARMREVLSQIRHTKADRPVFTPEFLARLKRVIVFGSLDRDAMHKIARKLVNELVSNGKASAASGWRCRTAWCTPSARRPTESTRSRRERKAARSCAS